MTDVIEAVVWPEAGAPMDDWLAMLADGSNDLEAPAIRIQPVIGEVLAALGPPARGCRGCRARARHALRSSSNEADAQHAAQTIRLDHPQWWVHAGVLS